MYGLTFALSFLMMPKSYTQLNKKWSIIIWLTLLLSVVVLFIAGRRIFWITTALSPFIVIFLLKASNIKYKLDIKLLLPFILAASYVFSTFDINHELMLEDFKSAFDFHDIGNEASYYRSQQADILLNEWMDGNIFLGAGHGASAKGIIRSDDAPWAYELLSSITLPNRHFRDICLWWNSDSSYSLERLQ